jgi:hypothetical protein
MMEEMKTITFTCIERFGTDRNATEVQFTTEDPTWEIQLSRFFDFLRGQGYVIDFNLAEEVFKEHQKRAWDTFFE